MVVGTLNVLIDFLDQFLHTAKRSPANGLLGDPVKPDLYLVQPGSISRSEVYVESRRCSEPALDSRMLVGRVVVYDHMDVQLGRHVVVNLSQEIQILLVPMALSAMRNYPRSPADTSGFGLPTSSARYYSITVLTEIAFRRLQLLHFRAGRFRSEK